MKAILNVVIKMIKQRTLNVYVNGKQVFSYVRTHEYFDIEDVELEIVSDEVGR